MIARTEDGELPIHVAPVDALDLLETVRGRFARRAGEQQVAIALAAPPDLVLDADGVRLEQALGNLLDNALRHGGGDLELAAERARDAVEIHVRDAGPGFPDGFVATAFERFTRADSARGRGGAGLGLAIVAAVARAHGGTAGARNRPDGGADVWLALPERA